MTDSTVRAGRRVLLAACAWGVVGVTACRAELPRPGPPAASPAEDGTRDWFRWEYDGTTGRRWAPASPIDPSTLDSGMVMYEVTQYPNATEPTPEQLRAAEELQGSTFESAKRHGWFDFEKATADGFELMYTDPVHYVNHAFASDGVVLDPDRPEFLLFYDTPVGKRLAGVMYLGSGPAEHGPQIGGPSTVWHYHIWKEPRCLAHGLVLVADPSADGDCPRGSSLRHESPEMMHVWFVEHPVSPFDTGMELPIAAWEQMSHPDWPRRYP